MFNKTVKEIHIEPTSICNAECPMCARNINGKGLNPYITLKSLPVKWFEDNITPTQIKQLNKIFFCGNVGDPASAPELIQIAEYFKKHIENAMSFISTGARAHWDMLVFEHNKHQVDEAKDLAKEMGFRWFRAKETDRWDTYTSNLGILPANEFTNKTYTNNITCEKDRDNSVFLDYTGKLWPCCHMAEAYLNKIGLELHSDIREYNNKE